MSTRTSLILAIAAFGLIATANSGGYRYGISDQAFYVPAVALAQSPDLFPRDRVLLAPQMRLWAGDELFGGLARLTFGHLPTLFAVLYVVTLVALAGGAIALARSLGCSWWAIAGFLILLTLRHRIARTGANSLEGYFHPRMLAFALGLFALAAVARQRLVGATLWTLAAGIVHTTTAIWFGGIVAIAGIWPWRYASRLWMGLIALTVASLWMANRTVPQVFTRMDEVWLNVVAGKDYLFSSQWPLYAWVSNLAYPVVLAVLHQVRRRRGLTAPGEDALVGGLLALVVVFLVSVPLTDAHLAMAVQMQVNRVFWLLDVAVVLYLAWWLFDGATVMRRLTVRRVVLALLFVAAVGRGFYVLRIEADRSLVTLGLPDNAWTEAMRWIAQQPEGWHVLADPDHGWKYGSSVRVAARRDTLAESTKDSALALYDRAVAARVADRLDAVGAWDEITIDDVRALDTRFALDVLVDTAAREFPLPVLYRNEQFVVYDLR